MATQKGALYTPIPFPPTPEHPEVSEPGPSKSVGAHYDVKNSIYFREMAKWKKMKKLPKEPTQEHLGRLQTTKVANRCKAAEEDWSRGGGKELSQSSDECCPQQLQKEHASYRGSEETSPLQTRHGGPERNTPLSKIHGTVVQKIGSIQINQRNRAGL